MHAAIIFASSSNAVITRKAVTYNVTKTLTGVRNQT